MKFTDPNKISTAKRETNRFHIVRIEDGAERVQNSKPRISQNRKHLFMVWDSEKGLAI